MIKIRLSNNQIERILEKVNDGDIVKKFNEAILRSDKRNLRRQEHGQS